MKKFIFLSMLALSFLTGAFAVPTTSPPIAAVNAYDKADSTVLGIANGLGVLVDTNASVSEIAADIKSAYGTVPNSKSPVSYWIKFVLTILGIIGTIYFAVRHQLLKQAVAKGAAILLIIFAIGVLGSGCKTTFVHTQDGDIVGSTPLGKQGYDLQYLVAYHTAPGQNDTASLSLIGPDSTTNNLINDFKDYVNKKFPLGK